MYFYSWTCDDIGYCFVTGVITTKSYVKKQELDGRSELPYFPQTNFWLLHDPKADIPFTQSRQAVQSSIYWCCYHKGLMLFNLRNWLFHVYPFLFFTFTGQQTHDYFLPMWLSSGHKPQKSQQHFNLTNKSLIHLI